jgi:hypothetical protein
VCVGVPICGAQSNRACSVQTTALDVLARRAAWGEGAAGEGAEPPCGLAVHGFAEAWSYTVLWCLLELAPWRNQRPGPRCQCRVVPCRLDALAQPLSFDVPVTHAPFACNPITVPCVGAAQEPSGVPVFRVYPERLPAAGVSLVPGDTTASVLPLL